MYIFPNSLVAVVHCPQFALAVWLLRKMIKFNYTAAKYDKYVATGS